MEEPKFSICIPNYNYAHYIRETIQSVLNQSYLGYEIVIVDNASTDDSVEVIQSFQSDRIRLFCNQYNVGYAPNLDRVAIQAHYPYLLMLSSDDLMHPTALAEYAAVIKQMGALASQTLIVSTIDIIDSEGRKNGQRARPSYYTLEAESQFATGVSGAMVETFSGLTVFKSVFPRMSVPGPFCSTMYSRELYEKVSGYSSVHHIGPDAHFAYKLLLQNATVAFVDKPLFSYRVHNRNQLAQNKRITTIKVPIDRYLFALQYTDDELARAGVQRNEMIHFLIEDTCLKGGLHELREGSLYQAFRYLMFALATYPGVTLRNGKSYALAFLLLLGPFAPFVARVFYALRKR